MSTRKDRCIRKSKTEKEYSMLFKLWCYDYPSHNNNIILIIL